MGLEGDRGIVTEAAEVMREVREFIWESRSEGEKIGGFVKLIESSKEDLKRFQSAFLRSRRGEGRIVENEPERENKTGRWSDGASDRVWRLWMHEGRFVRIRSRVLGD